MLPTKAPQGSQIDFGHPLARGLIAGWRIAEGAGVKLRSIPNKRNDASFGFGTPTWSTGPRGKAIALSSAQFNAGAPIFTAAPFSVVFLCKVTTASSGAGQNAITIADVSFTDYFIAGLSSTGVPFTKISHSTPVSFTAGNAVANNQWVHIAVTFTDVTAVAAIYQDGVFQGSQSMARLPVSLSQIVIGAFNTNQFFNGSIDHLYVYNRTLTGSDVAQLYKNPDAFLVVPRPALSGLVVITGTGASAESGEASAASGSITFTGTLASHSSGEASALSGKSTITGVVSSTSSGEASAGVVSLSITGSVSETSSGEASASSGQIHFTGALTSTSSGEASAGSGHPAEIGSISETSSGEGSSGAGSLTINGAGAQTSAEHSSGAGSLNVFGAISETSSGEGSFGLGLLSLSGAVSETSSGERSIGFAGPPILLVSLSSGESQHAIGAVHNPMGVCGVIAVHGAGKPCLIAAPGGGGGCIALPVYGAGKNCVIPL